MKSAKVVAMEAFRQALFSAGYNRTVEIAGLMRIPYHTAADIKRGRHKSGLHRRTWIRALYAPDMPPRIADLIRQNLRLMEPKFDRNHSRRDRVARDQYDGKPYFCSMCGEGYREYLACEEANCKLESEDAAKMRCKNRRKLGSDAESVVSQTKIE